MQFKNFIRLNLCKQPKFLQTQTFKRLIALSYLFGTQRAQKIITTQEQKKIV